MPQIGLARDLQVLGKRLDDRDHAAGVVDEPRIVGGGRERRGVALERAPQDVGLGRPEASGSPRASSGRACAAPARPTATSFTVSVIGTAAIAPSIPGSSAAMQRSTSSRVTSGRAASCTTAIVASGAAASALRTDAERDSPPRTRSGASS